MIEHTRRAARSVAGVALGVSLAVALSACGSSTQGAPASSQPASAGGSATAIVLGTKDFTEQHLLGQLYKQALEAKGFHVVYRQDVGSTAAIDAALRSGKIGMYPEYVGVILTVFGKRARPGSAGAAYRQAKRLEESRGFTLLARTPFFDSEALATLASTARRYGLKTVADLKKVPGLTIGGPPEFRTSAQGLVGLKRLYGLAGVKFVPLAGIGSYAALDASKVLAAAVFSTDPQLAGSRYAVLADPRHAFGFQNVAPVVSQRLLKALGPRFAETVDAVSAQLSMHAMIAMNRAVALDGQSAASVARRFLAANGLT